MFQFKQLAGAQVFVGYFHQQEKAGTNEVHFDVTTDFKGHPKRTQIPGFRTPQGPCF